MTSNENSPEFNRREFLKSSSLAAVMAMMGGVELHAEQTAKPGASAETLTPVPAGPPVNFGVIGAGAWGREIINTLAQLPNAPVVAICDNYPGALTRAGESAPKAELINDYQKLIAKKEIQAVVVATPTHHHAEIVLATLAAGKHVYCEAPLANSIDDAKSIARAARLAFKQVFQSGLQERSHPQRHFLWTFIRSGVLGRNVMIRAQSHKKQSWARTSPNAARDREINWRLHRATSTGLIGEIGIHQLDAVSWFMSNHPVAVTGFSSLILWRDDGRDVPDTVQCVFDLPDGARFFWDGTLCNSFEAQYEMYYGENAAIMVRDNKAWMFKEPDSPFLGWEGFARKDNFYTEVGVALIANATKQAALGTNPIVASPYPFSPLYYALEAFTFNVRQTSDGMEDFVTTFPDADAQALRDHLAAIKKHPAAGWQEGLDATVLAIKANEAALNNQRLTLERGMFDL